MTRQAIIDTINKLMADEFEADPAQITATADFRETLGLDSLDYVDLVVAVEGGFGVKLVEADFADITNFDSFYSLIENKLQTKAG